MIAIVASLWGGVPFMRCYSSLILPKH